MMNRPIGIKILLLPLPRLLLLSLENFEPIRRLGVDLSQARLQQELLALGFNKQVSSLSQADKAVLRYIAIMKQTTNIQGNLAQTISSPANMVRILKSEISQLAKAVGQLLYPAFKAILPVLIAAVDLIKEFVSLSCICVRAEN